MSTIEQAREFLMQIGASEKQRNDMCCYVLIALSNMAQKSAWTEADTLMVFEAAGAFILFRCPFSTSNRGFFNFTVTVTAKHFLICIPSFVSMICI